jgi:ribonucleoside-diphosphate reductase beta chain
MSRLWFMPATPVLSNGGTTRGLPTSCFLNSVSDSLDGIVGAVTAAVRDDIVDVARTMVKLEENFVDLAFGLGEIEGMRSDEIHSYVRYVADWRLTQLGLIPVFGYFSVTEGGYTQLKPHPLPWLVEILNGVEHANFFEQRATEYSKAASRGAWDSEDGVWATFSRMQRRSAANG